MSEIEKIIDDVKIAFAMWDSEYGIGDKEWESMNTAINLLKNSADHNGWISVNDRLPEKETLVIALVQYEVGWYRIFAWRDDKGWVSSAEEFQESDGDYVTHWMPLPEPPKEGKQND